MSLRHAMTGVAGAVFASVLLILATPVSGADFDASGTGTMKITFEVPSTPGPSQPDPNAPFDWNWKYQAPTCDGVTIAFPSNLPASQQGVMEVQVVGGSVSGMQYKLEYPNYQKKYPNGHAGQTVFISWSDFRNSKIPATGTWTVTQLQVHGTNYHWQGKLECGSALSPKKVAAPAPAPAAPLVVQPEPQSQPTPEPVPTPEPSPVPVPPQPSAPKQDVEPDQVTPTPIPSESSSGTSGEVPVSQSQDQEGTTQE